MDILLKNFQNDEHTREAVRSFIYDYFSKKAVEKVFNGENVEYLKEARDVVEDAFSELKELYEDTKKKETVNEAR